VAHAHKAPKTIYKNAPVVCRTNSYNQASTTIAPKEFHISNEKQIENQVPVFNPQLKHFVNHENKIKYNITIAAREPILNVPKDPDKPQLSDTTRIRLASMVNNQARVSQQLGIAGISLMLFSLGLWAMVQVLKNSGIAWATSMLGVAVVSTGVAVGGILAVLAIIFAIVAFHRIHQERAKYSGPGKAVTGIIFSILILGIIGYLALAIYGK